MAKSNGSKNKILKATNIPASVVPSGVIPIDDAGAKRLQRIAEAAYKRAEQRGFEPGNDLDDWLAAEKEIDGQPAVDRKA